ncbi:MAG TPA: DNA polymerase IV [Candidatus Cloacimonas sp.]|jgi:DNA polymerase-4|nr:DNA polymerase IV [Candidatus Cloacimonadota bacterium]HNZ33332.1 DNA polymerase IV [Candidatus Cloacimonas sp.]HOG27269.1 DNA polymerase IV [Candidatus Cloacimonas sp.]HOQ78415.1 DNA polymerase IV [Candidatus Cloacimonas sp.]HPH71468.1 DNA polymerase IV [Candidatus Cloacimonas sp.]
MKKIIHIDMDAFFAAIEIRENPRLKGKCVIVGGPPNSRGVVSTCSYEARKFGVHSGMSSYQAWNLCPDAIFVDHHFNLYIQVSNQIREIFYKWTDTVEPMSLDEAYLDVTVNKMGEEDTVKIAQLIKEEVFLKTQLTCSAGVSYNKFLAKIGSDLNKPNGLTFIPPEKAKEVLFALPIEKFHGIGKVTAARMKKMGINNGADLYKRELKDLLMHFGKIGIFYYYVVRGIDNRELITNFEPKTLSCETTFDKDVDNLEELLTVLHHLSERLSERLHRKGIRGNSLTLKLKYDNFQLITRSCRMQNNTYICEDLYKYGEQLLIANWDCSRKVRLLGLGISNLDNVTTNEQLLLPL